MFLSLTSSLSCYLSLVPKINVSFASPVFHWHHSYLARSRFLFWKQWQNARPFLLRIAVAHWVQKDSSASSIQTHLFASPLKIASTHVITHSIPTKKAAHHHSITTEQSKEIASPVISNYSQMKDCKHEHYSQTPDTNMLTGLTAS